MLDYKAFVFQCRPLSCYATQIIIYIHLVAFDQIVHREIDLIAFTLMTFSKARAPELKMITRDLCRNDKAPF